jgi:hypothetical protein
MALQSLGLGTTAGDGTGDSIRDGGDKINDNFSEIYTLLGTGTALSSGISATATVVTLAAPSITGAASFADGSVSAPAITNIGDSNTGIFFSAADTVSVTTGGTKRVDIDSSGITVTGATSTTTLAVSSTSAFSGNASHADNVKALFGTGNDLEIYHDGSNSIIKDNGTGNLSLRADDFQLTNSTFGENYITAANNGAVALYHDNAVKLATSAAGGTLTGEWVQTANIADDAVTEAKMANDAISSVELKTLSTLLIKNSGGSTLATFHTAGA